MKPLFIIALFRP
uniref:Uncharacterized protein n=1 Tax=Arundo donax TaxID=35708 RepID=A0A0A9BMD7_ARUDO